VRKSRVAVVALGVSLTLAGSALAGDARKLTLRGGVEGDAGARARLTVVKQGGEPRSVRNVQLRNLRVDCGDDSDRIKLLLSGAAKLNDQREFERAYSDGRSTVRLEGKVREDGRRVAAQIRGTSIEVSGSGRCKVPDRTFIARKR